MAGLDFQLYEVVTRHQFPIPNARLRVFVTYKPIDLNKLSKIRYEVASPETGKTEINIGQLRQDLSDLMEKVESWRDYRKKTLADWLYLKHSINTASLLDSEVAIADFNNRRNFMSLKRAVAAGGDRNTLPWKSVLELPLHKINKLSQVGPSTMMHFMYLLLKTLRYDEQLIAPLLLK